MDTLTKIDREATSGLRVISGVFLHIEHAIYVALGLALALAAIIALASASADLWGAMQHTGGLALLTIIDQLLFVLMLAEILHTVRVSLRSGALTCEPFLVVGLIASIRRVLVITLESSQASPGKSMDAAAEELFRTSMIELGVLGGLILIMVVSIYILRSSGSGGRMGTLPADD